LCLENKGKSYESIDPRFACIPLCNECYSMPSGSKHSSNIMYFSCKSDGRLESTTLSKEKSRDIIEIDRKNIITQKSNFLS
jgi:hypothetical protein